MSERRRTRHLRPDERVLWETVARTARPLRGDMPGKANAPLPAAAEEEEREAGPAPVRGFAKTAPGPLEPLDRRLRARLARGTAAIDGRLDLHGLTQREAHARLKSFLTEAQLRGARVVLVITGKGRPEGAAPLAEDARGVLRRAVPLWLASPEFRPFVSGFDEAHRTHGGAGALYVRVRRLRESAG
jgi:DNA-nicking Smr family endonuclease